jgi:hypothetical protein
LKRKRTRLLFLALCVSMFIHSFPTLWGLFSFALHHDVNVHETDGEATFPVDLLTEEAPRPLQPQVLEPNVEQAPRQETVAPKDKAIPGETFDGKKPDPAHHPPVLDGGTAEVERQGLATGDVSPLAHGDAGTPRDGSAPIVDAATDAIADAGTADAVSASDAGDASASGGDAALVAIGAGDAPKNTIELVINAQVIRAHPAASRLETLLGNIHQWKDFFQGIHLRPLRDIDWIGIYGPGLLTTDRDVFMLQYAAPDRVVDDAVAALASKAGHRGRPFDVGVEGLPATLAFADRAERVIFRVRPRVVAIVPPGKAHDQAMAYTKMQAGITGPTRSGEAVSMTINDPHRVMPDIFPETVRALHLSVTVRDDGGADVDVVGDCPGVVQCQALQDDVKLALDTVGTRTVGALFRFKVPPGLSASAEALSRATFGYDARHFSARVTASTAVIEELIDYAAKIDHIQLPAYGALPPTTPPKLPPDPTTGQ